MKLIDADYLTGRMFTEADLTNAHTCYDSIRAIIESMESEDVLDKIRAEIEALPRELPTDARNMVRRTRVLQIIDRYMAESESKE